MDIFGSMLPFILIILVFYFLILRPQQKRQKDKQKMLQSVKKGDKVITAGGMHGQVEGVEDKIVLVKIADGIKVKVEKSSIGNIVGVTDNIPKRR
ncbi:MAG: preprotein translocase subunit YajC [Ignavibacteria bacterium]|nr:preprotein translocase subunit YajC [Ignavibacteria bacterium]